MERTILYRELVRLANPKAETEIPKPNTDKITAQASSIAASITQLQRYTASVRPAYLASVGTQKFTEKQREEIGMDIEHVLHTMHRKIQQLEQVEQARALSTQPKGLARLIPDTKLMGARQTLEMHRKGVFMCLNLLLRAASDNYAELQHVQLARDFGHAKPVSTGAHKLNLTHQPVLETTPGDQMQVLQTLESENSHLMEELRATLDKSLQAERSMQEISNIQTQLSQHISFQSDQIQELFDDAFRTTEDVGGANAQLQQAKHRNRRASKVIIWASIIIALVLLLNDLVL